MSTYKVSSLLFLFVNFSVLPSLLNSTIYSVDFYTCNILDYVYYYVYYANSYMHAAYYMYASHAPSIFIVSHSEHLAS